MPGQSSCVFYHNISWCFWIVNWESLYSVCLSVTRLCKERNQNHIFIEKQGSATNHCGVSSLLSDARFLLLKAHTHLIKTCMVLKYNDQATTAIDLCSEFVFVLLLTFEHTTGA